MLVLAVIWAGWHLPMFFVVNNFRSFSAGTIVGWLLGLTAGSILLGWLYNRSGGSVVLVAVWHAGFNLVSATAAATGLLAAVVTSTVMVAAVALVVAEILAGRRGRSKRPRPAGSVANLPRRDVIKAAVLQVVDSATNRLADRRSRSCGA